MAHNGIINMTASIVCSSNVSDMWTMITPICSSRHDSLLMFVIVGILLSVITLWTIVGNIMVLIVLCRSPSLRTMSNCLIGNLALSDLLLAITVMPISTNHDLLGYWVFGEELCTVWLCIDVLYCTASIWCLCSVAFDRYLATVYPVWYHDQKSERKALTFVIFVWIFSIAVSLAPFVGWPFMIPNFFTFDHKTNTHDCVLFTSSSYVIYSAISSFVLPACLMVFMYIRIFNVIHKQADTMKQKMTTRNNSKKVLKNTNSLKNSTQSQLNEDVFHESNGQSASASEDGSSSGSKRSKHPTFSLEITGRQRTVFFEDDDKEASSFIEDINESILDEGSTLSIHHIPQVRCTTQRRNTLAIPGDRTFNESSKSLSVQSVNVDSLNCNNVAELQRQVLEGGMIGGIHKEHNNILNSHSNHSNSVKDLYAQNTDTNGKKRKNGRHFVHRQSLPCIIAKIKIKRHKGMTTSMTQRLQLREQRATKRMLIIMACFCVCWTPFVVWYITRSICETCDFNQHLVAAIIWLGYVNSSINPILYILFNDDFKAALKNLLGFNTNTTKGRRALIR